MDRVLYQQEVYSGLDWALYRQEVYSSLDLALYQQEAYSSVYHGPGPVTAGGLQ